MHHSQFLSEYFQDYNGKSNQKIFEHLGVNEVYFDELENLL